MPPFTLYSNDTIFLNNIIDWDTSQVADVQDYYARQTELGIQVHFERSLNTLTHSRPVEDRKHELMRKYFPDVFQSDYGWWLGDYFIEQYSGWVFKHDFNYPYGVLNVAKWRIVKNIDHIIADQEFPAAFRRYKALHGDDRYSFDAAIFMQYEPLIRAYKDFPYEVCGSVSCCGVEYTDYLVRIR